LSSFGDKKVVGVFVRFSCAASQRDRELSGAYSLSCVDCIPYAR
jgi:hypothetical protein